MKFWEDLIKDQKVEVELKDGQVFCPKCKGNGEFQHSTCPKCLGTGVLDWLERVCGKHNPRSVLDQLNVKRMMGYINHKLNNFIYDPVNPVEVLKHDLDETLGDIQARNGIVDYNIQIYPQLDDGKIKMDVYIKPTAAMEYITMNVIINPEV